MDILLKVFSASGFMVTSVLAFSLLVTAIKILFVDTKKYNRLRVILTGKEKSIIKGFKHSFNGEVDEASVDGQYHLIRAGLSKKGNVIKQQARLSDEAIRSLIEPIR